MIGDRGRRIWLTTVGVLSACLSLAAVAWACTPTADLQVGRSAGAPGTPMTFSGHGFGNGLVQIRMDAVNSAPVVTATGPDFSVTIPVPQTTPGYHVFGAVGYNSAGDVVGSTAVSFDVIGPTPPSRHPARPVTPRPAPGPAPVHRAPSAPPHAPHPVASSPVAAASPRAATRPAPAAIARSSQARPQGFGAPHAWVTPMAAPSPPRRHAPRSAARASHARVLTRPNPAPLWAPKPEQLGGPASTGMSAPLAIGIGVLAVGLVALFGGFTVAEVRRRRAFGRARRR